MIIFHFIGKCGHNPELLCLLLYYYSWKPRAREIAGRQHASSTLLHICNLLYCRREEKKNEKQKTMWQPGWFVGLLVGVSCVSYSYSIACNCKWKSKYENMQQNNQIFIDIYWANMTRTIITHLLTHSVSI